MVQNRKHIEPRIPKGLQDLLPQELIARKKVVTRIESVFEKYGFVPVDTPAIEYLDTLLGTGGEETNKELFRFETPEEEAVALRFDLTVPFARLLAQYPDVLKVPFRRYAAGPVWRADKPGPGRFRQFTQLDIDIAGAADPAVDAEVIAVMCEVMQTLGVGGYTVLINSRKLLDALLEGAGITDGNTQKHVCRVIDKLDKVGLESVKLELGNGRVDASGDPIPGVGLDDSVAEAILEFIEVDGETRAQAVENMARALPVSDAAAAAVDEMNHLGAALEVLGITDAQARFDPSLARGLDYYTGTVFETVLPDAPEFGSVMGGGRYNQLVARFLDRPIACTGMSVGLDRLMAALKHLDLAPAAKTTVQALVITVGKVAKSESLQLAAELRAAGIATEIYIAGRKKMGLKFQLAHADHYGIPVAVILGEEELANEVVSVKDLEAGKRQREHIAEHETYREAGKTGQLTVPRGEVVKTVKNILAGHV